MYDRKKLQSPDIIHLKIIINYTRKKLFFASLPRCPHPSLTSTMDEQHGARTCRKNHQKKKILLGAPLHLFLVLSLAL